jgi:hypothetical protein
MTQLYSGVLFCLPFYQIDWRTFISGNFDLWHVALFWGRWKSLCLWCLPINIAVPYIDGFWSDPSTTELHSASGIIMHQLRLHAELERPQTLQHVAAGRRGGWSDRLLHELTVSNERHVRSRQELSLKAVRRTTGAFDYCIRYVGRNFATAAIGRPTCRRWVSNICLRLRQMPSPTTTVCLLRAYCMSTVTSCDRGGPTCDVG